MTWELGEFWRQHGTSELWESATDNFASATKVWEGRSTSVSIKKLDTVTRYYWVTLAAIGGQRSDPEPISNGVPAAALPIQKTLEDPHFELKTDQTYWWYGSATGVSISLTGGVVGGRAILTGDSSSKSLLARGGMLYRCITSQDFKIYLRWRRTGSITSASGTDTIIIATLNTVDGAAPWGSGQASSAQITLDRNTINAATVNEWQQSSVTTTLNNVAPSSPQLQYLGAFFQMSPNCTGGVVEIDAMEVIPV